MSKRKIPESDESTAPPSKPKCNDKCMEFLFNDFKESRFE